jgi:transposase-like protein
MAAGETPSDLAKEYGVHPSQVTRRVSQVSQSVRNAAQKMAEAQAAVAELPTAQQYHAMSLAEKIRNTMTSLASSAELGAKNSHRLSALANSELMKVDDADPMKSVETLKGVSALTKLANESASIAVSVLGAQRDTVKRVTEEAPPEEEELTPERIAEGVRRIAFTLHKAAATENT